MALGLPPANLRVALQATDAQFNETMARAERRTHSTAAGMNRAFARLDRGARRSFARIGASVTALAGTFAALTVGAAVREFTRFEKSLSDLSAITGATGKDLKFLSDAAKDLSRTSTQSATSVLRSFALIASAKPDLLENVDALNKVTKAAVILAEATGQDVATAGKTLTTALNQFGAGADQAERFINALAAGAQKGAVEVGPFSVALVKAGTVAKEANISFEELTATIQTLAPLGTPVEQIGTSLRNVFLELLSGADKTNPRIVGLEQALINLGEELNSAAEFEKKFGKENVVVALQLVRTAKEAANLTRVITGTTAAQEQAATRTDNLSGDTDKLLNSFSNLATEMGDLVDGPLRGIIQDITSATDATAGFIAEVNRLSDELDELAARAENAESPIQRIARALGLSAEGFPVTPGGAAQEGLLQDLRNARIEAQFGALGGPGPQPRGRRPRIEIAPPAGTGETGAGTSDDEKARDKARQQIEDTIRSLEDEARVAGVAAQQRDQLRTIIDLENIARKAGIQLTAEQLERTTAAIAAKERESEIDRILARDEEFLRAVQQREIDLSEEIEDKRLLLRFAGEETEEYRVQARLLAIRRDLGEAAAASMESEVRASENLTRTLQELDELRGAQEHQIDQLQSAVEDLGLTFTSAFEDAVIEGKAFQDILQGIFQDVQRLILRKGITEPLLGALTLGAEGRSTGEGGAGAISSAVATITSPFRSGAPGQDVAPPPPKPPVPAAFTENIETAGLALMNMGELAEGAGGSLAGSLAPAAIEAAAETGLETAATATAAAGKATETTAVVTATGALTAMTASAQAAAQALAAVAGSGGGGGAGGLLGLFGGGGGGLGPQFTGTGAEGLLAAGSFASGGRVTGGQAIVVGEEGPELFVPPMSGDIIPNDRLGGGAGVVVNQTNNLMTGLEQVVRAEFLRSVPQIKAAAVQGVLDAKQRGGNFASAF